MVETLSKTKFRILDALKVYRYLTTDQFMRLGVTSHKSHLYAIIRELANGKQASVNKLAHGVVPGYGRLPHLYFLTKHGARLLADALFIEPREIPYPRGAVMIQTHFHHRLNCVDCEIAVRQWAEKNKATIDFYYSYFDVTGANRSKIKSSRRSKTKIELKSGNAIIPDSVFRITTPDGKSRLFVLEMHNQLRTKRMTEQLDEYRYAIGEEAINLQFDYPHAPRILIVFDSEKALSLTKKRLAELGGFEDYAPFFFFNTLECFKTDFLENWQKLAGKRQVSLIATITKAK